MFEVSFIANQNYATYSKFLLFFYSFAQVVTEGATPIQCATIVKLFSGDFQEAFTRLDNYLINCKLIYL